MVVRVLILRVQRKKSFCKSFCFRPTTNHLKKSVLKEKGHTRWSYNVVWSFVIPYFFSCLLLPFLFWPHIFCVFCVVLFYFLFAAFFAVGFAFAAWTLGALAAALPAAGATVLAALRAKHRTVWRNIGWFLVTMLLTKIASLVLC